MRFTPIEELEGFGKRRRLTEADRNRLADYGRRPAAPDIALLRQRRREYTPGVDKAGDMEIRINQAPARKDEDIGPSRSSQTMLLDCESPYLEHILRLQNNRDTHTNPGQVSASVHRSTSLLSTLAPTSPVTELLPFSPIAQDDDIGRFTDGSIFGQRLSPELLEKSPASTSPSYAFQPVDPPIRRFTIDDQVLAGQDGLLNASSTVPEARHMSRQSGEGRGSTSLFMRTQSPARQSSASMEHPPWLPQPSYSIRRPVNREVKDTSDMVTSKVSQGRYDQNHFAHVSPNLIASTTEQFTSPLKIFGQSVAP